jgi:hypothetical protein
VVLKAAKGGPGGAAQGVTGTSVANDFAADTILLGVSDIVGVV